MAISRLYIRNFKGVDEGRWVDIKPITVFIGANSSGKSSCIHALACLSQTLKLPNNSAPIIIDDEYANVHLGRFIEVIHSKSYQNTISLGFTTGEIQFVELDENEKKPKKRKSKVEVKYEFKCSQRTQDIRIETASINMLDVEFTIKWNGKSYTVTNKKTSSKFSCSLGPGFLITPDSIFGKTTKNTGDFLPLLAAQSALSSELLSTCYLGPFRESPRRKYETWGATPTEVGARGEAAITMLANESFQTTKRPHIKQIAGWLKKLGLAKEVSIKRVGKSDLVDLKLGLNDGGSFPIADLGYGLSQVMPVLTQCSFAEKGTTLLFEQPEIHLHTKSSRELATVFIDTAKEKGSNIVLETHSPDLVKQFMRELKQGNLQAEDFVLYKVTRENGATCINQIEIDSGNDFDVYDNWETGISI
ncbi:MAG: AAA family ATPase [Candidatus Thiodiazotropha taylori]|uniref:AAA family ATPase n=1 Tax=Candidatus Thiodiazotropha taylori TaxID=2792791 RepID=A0A9E4N7L5_9GAMM|nr:AAA family ATPase [Candidatus Thiodiazotropha taylori]MCW4259101.1 AAA family ATPase [Candidatus Thiodiazotropha taylori]